MTRDEWVMAVLIVAFAVFVTAHVMLVAGLAGRTPRWRALAAAFALPLAPFWGIRERMFGRAAVWVASAAVYVVARWLAGRE